MAGGGMGSARAWDRLPPDERADKNFGPRGVGPGDTDAGRGVRAVGRGSSGSRLPDGPGLSVAVWVLREPRVDGPGLPSAVGLGGGDPARWRDWAAGLLLGRAAGVPDVLLPLPQHHRDQPGLLPGP